MTIEESLKRLEDYITEEKYQGYDPYDILNSYIPFKKLGKWPSAIATQIHKRNPFNLRPLLGIKKGINPKAYGLFLQAYSLLYQKTKNEQYLEKANYFYNWLSDNFSPGYTGKCWGYNFPWASPLKYMEAFVPSSVVTGFVVKGLYEYYKAKPDNADVSALIKSACDFLDNDLEKVRFSEGISVSYTPVQKDVCYNASLLAGESFAKLYVLSKNEHYRELAIQIVNYVLSKQKKDGHWEYSLDLKTGKERSQIDFHQGYILESIYEIKDALGINNQSWDDALNLGLKYYIERQFNKGGWSYWRVPKKYPIDIHNQSQGIITCIKLKSYNKDAVTFSRNIATWTIANMQSCKGYFYYRKFKKYTNKTSYMRWNNAWMFLALTSLLDS